MTTPQSPPSPQKFVRCPSCSERLGVREQDAGRRARCTKCGRVFVIGGGAPEAASPATATAPPDAPIVPIPPPEPPAPEWVSFSCSLCDTRLSARVAEVGNKIACPDCGRKNVVPPPPKPKKVQLPAAMSGEQLGVWAADVKTWEPGFATGASLHPVTCRVCQTLMYATDEQVGLELKCPDCGAATIAKRSSQRKPVERLAPTGEELELDPASAPTPRPVPALPAVGNATLNQAAFALSVGSVGKVAPLKKIDLPEERPVRPRVPLVQGVWSMLFTEEILTRWLMMSLLFGGAAWCFVDSVNTPIASISPIFGIFLMLGAVGIGVLWATFAAPTYLAVLSESAEGSNRLHDPPGWSPFEWLTESFFFVTTIGVAAMPGMLTWGLGAPLPIAAIVGLGCGAALLIFPVAMLGTMVENTPLGVISPMLLSTLVRAPGPWLLFYVETTLLAAAVGGTGFGLYTTSPVAASIAMPLLAMAASLIYMRLLGRLAWWLSDFLPQPEEKEEVDESAAAHPHFAAARAQARAEQRAAEQRAEAASPALRR